MNAFAGLLRKEALTFITNKTFVVLVGLPVIVAVLFNLAFTNERPVATIALLPPADPALAALVQSDIASLGTLHVTLVTADLAAARDAALHGRLSHVIDARALRRDGAVVRGRIGVVVDELRPVSAQVVQSSIAALVAKESGNEPSIGVDLSVIRGVSPRQATIPLWLVTITLVIAISSMPLSLVEEREQRTLRALLVAPTARWVLLSAKATVGIAMILAMAALIVVLNGVSLGDPGLLAVALLCGAFAFVPVGLFLGALSPNQGSAGPFAALLLVALSLPVALAQTEGAGITNLANLLPSAALASIVRAAVVSTAGISDFVPQLVYLIAIGSIASLAAVWALGRESVMLT